MVAVTFIEFMVFLLDNENEVGGFLAETFVALSCKGNGLAISEAS